MAVRPYQSIEKNSSNGSKPPAGLQRSRKGSFVSKCGGFTHAGEQSNRSYQAGPGAPARLQVTDPCLHRWVRPCSCFAKVTRSQTSPFRAIEQVAHRIGSDLVVVGTSRFPLLKRVFIGSVSNEVLRGIEHDVLVVSPAAARRAHRIECSKQVCGCRPASVSAYRARGRAPYRPSGASSGQLTSRAEQAGISRVLVDNSTGDYDAKIFR
jgi:hypothetical protein